MPHISAAPARSVIATNADIETLLSNSNFPMRLFIILTLDSAMRGSEAVQVGHGNYDPTNKLARVRVKGGRYEQIPISDRAALLIQTAEQICPAAESYVLAAAGAKNLATIRKSWERLKRRSAVNQQLQYPRPQTNNGNKNLRPHA